MNRAERRAAAKAKPAKKHRHVNPVAAFQLMDLVRSYEPGDHTDQRLMQDLTVAHRAMDAIAHRYWRWKKLQLLDAERDALEQAIEIYEAITDHSSPMQMRNAVDAVMRTTEYQTKHKEATP